MVIAVDVQLRRESREVAVVYFIIQVVEGNILVPLVMRNAIGVPPFLVIVSILAGAAIGGIPGALISVPVVAALLVVVERLQARDSPVPLSPHSPWATSSNSWTTAPAERRLKVARLNACSRRNQPTAIL